MMENADVFCLLPCYSPVCFQWNMKSGGGAGSQLMASTAFVGHFSHNIIGFGCPEILLKATGVKNFGRGVCVCLFPSWWFSVLNVPFWTYMSCGFTFSVLYSDAK